MARSTVFSDLRVLLVAPLPPPHGGICFLTKALLDAGLGRGLHLVHLNTSKNTIREEFGRVTWLDLGLAVCNFARFAWLLLREHPQIVYYISTADTAIYRDWVFWLAARLVGCRIVLNLHGTRPSVKFASYSFHRWFVNRVASMASYIVVPNTVDWDGLKQIYSVDVPSEVVRNTTYVPEHFRQSLKRPEKRSGPVSLIVVGRLSEAKGAWDLLQALALVIKEEPSVSLTWVGLGASPSDDIYARELCASLGIEANVRLAGQVADSEKYLELEQSDIFVLPTHSEGFPLALLEAMAMGLPVVTTPVGGIPEVIIDGVNGYLVLPKDIESLADRILTLLREPDKREQMGEANRKLYWEQLSARKVVDRIHTLFEELPWGTA